jgi:ribosomal protein S18 acetylase RimI-like enzyme
MNFLLKMGLNSVGLYTTETNKAAVTLLKKLEFKIRHHWKFLTKHFEPSARRGC